MKYLSLLFILSIFFHLACHAQVSAQNSTPSPSVYEIGSKVKDFELKHVDGTIHSLSSIKDVNGYILIFTSNVCPFAVAYEDRIIKLHNLMSLKGFPVIAINANDGSQGSGDSFEDMITRHREKAFPFLYLKDDKGVYAQFGANKTPHVFLLDSDLTLRYKGAIDDSPRNPDAVEKEYVSLAIAALENGESPDPETTKAIGCPIKATGAGKRETGRKGPPSPAQIIERMDRNNDQMLSKDEVHGPLSEDFARLDQNNDGFLSHEELSRIKRGKR